MPAKSETGINKKLEALGPPEPKLVGKIVSEAEDGVVVQAGECVVEIARHHIADRTYKGDLVELTLKGDAEVLVSTAVSVQKGFVGDNVFGALLPGILACNCNCNCNCGEEARLRFDACNCNCNCDVSFNVLPESLVVRPVRVFRRPFMGGRRHASTE